MVPDAQRPEGELVELDPDGAIDVVLYWQQWRLHSPGLDRVAEAMRAAARATLDQPLRR
jgi:LysR family transcriptional regulator, chromosome initiation inhibitor